MAGGALESAVHPDESTATSPEARGRSETDVKSRLLEAAAHLLHEGGPGALSLREVARRAGVSHAAPYNHFPSKQALLVELAFDGWRQLNRSMADAQAMASPSTLDQLMASGLGYVRYALRNPATYKLMVQSEFRPPEDVPALLDCSDAAYERLRQAVTAVREERGLPLDPPAVETDCLVCWGLVHGLAMLSVDTRVPHLMPDDMSLFRALLYRLGDIYGEGPRS